MYPKQGTKESDKAKNGLVKRNIRDTPWDHSGPRAVLLPECLCVKSFFHKTNHGNKDIHPLKNGVCLCDSGEGRAELQELGEGQILFL